MERGQWKGDNGRWKLELDPLSSAFSFPFSMFPLPPPLFRFGLVVGLLLVALGASFLTRRLMPDPLPAQMEHRSAGTGERGQVYFIDTEGWYRITDNERAVISPYGLRLGNLPEGLPMDLGRWYGRPLPLGPEIAEWFDNPEVALQREYRNANDDIVWLSIFGSRGPKSFRLFEHTPATCYPLSGWKMTQEDVETIEIGGGKIYAQRGVATNGSHELIVLYFYLWDNPDRDPASGVVSVRISAPILTNEAQTLRLLREDFLPSLFTDVVPWRRF